ncbi:S-adenosyl-L-methionine-dependent methyltransferase [Aspergillus aurantiobrunneus]
MKDLVIVPLNKKQVFQAGKYCQDHSNRLPSSITEQLRITEQLPGDESIMAISVSQCAWLMSFAQVLRPHRVLELGAFTGISSLALHEATKHTNTEIVTIDLSEKYLKIDEDAFRRQGATDRIRAIKGNCLEVLHRLEGQFDLIYLLSPRGALIVHDKIFPEEIQEPYLAIADNTNRFNRFVSSDPRITATLIPAFSGVTQIMWK